MSIFFPILIVVLIGLGILLRLKHRAARPLKLVSVVGLVGTVGGCVGALGWLGAETSGQGNIFHAVNPYLWSTLFGIGAALLLGVAVAAIALRIAQGASDRPERPHRKPDR